jgi:hypothetical protein
MPGEGAERPHWGCAGAEVQCWVCGAPANGVCRFCGRAVCKEHARTMAYLLATFQGPDGPMGLGLEDALHCGVCRPRPDPIRVDL